MSPEQARGEPADRRSDVFALGRILAFVAGPNASPELSAIANRASEADPNDRYPDAKALAADLEAWLDGRQVSVYAYSSTELLGRLIRRWRVPIAVGAIGLAGLTVAVIAGVLNTARERDRALEAEAQLTSLLANVRAEVAVRELQDGDTSAAALEAAQSMALRETPLGRGVLAATDATPSLVRESSVGIACSAEAIAPDGLSIGCRSGSDVLWLSVDGTERARTTSPGRIGFSTADRLLVQDQGVIVELAADGTTRRLGAGLGRSGLRTAPRGYSVAIANQDDIALFTTDGQEQRIRCPDGHNALTVSPTSVGYLVACDAGLLLDQSGATSLAVPRVSAVAELRGERLYGTLDGEVLSDARSYGNPGIGPIRRIEASLDERWVAIGGESGAIRILDRSAGGFVASLPADGLNFAWQADRLVTLGDAIDTWRIAPRASVIHTDGGVADLAIGPEGELAIADGNGIAYLYAADGQRIGRYGWQNDVLKSVAFADDGAVWAGGERWSVRRIQGGSIVDPAVDLHARSLAAWDGGIAIASWSDHASWIGPDGAVTSLIPGVVQQLAATPAGLLVVAENPWIRLHSASGDRLIVDGPADPGGLVAISPDGQRIAVIRGSAVRILDTATTDELAAFVLPDAPSAAAFDGTALYTGYVDGTLRATGPGGELTLEVRLHEGRISDLELDGDSLWSGSWDRTVRRWAISR